ncbi:MerR family transcriptional regulator [Paenibacillus filicis]|uniref:MerR family transcriptional regulator n=1 Tax=Paenibacillus filicis TaxID=669464 RepID=A0ABU9DLW6_9BACL
MFKIGDFSRLSSISIRMLRHYDKLGLLVPDYIDEQTGYRHYTARQLRQVNKIQRLKEMGFTLGVIKEMLARQDSIEQLRWYFSVREAEVREELDLLHKQSKLLESSIELLREDVVRMDYHVTVKEIPARHVISLRQIIPSYAHEGQLWESAGAEMARQHVSLAEVPYVVAIFHDPEHRESDVDVEVQLAVEGRYADQGGIVFKDVPGIRVASVMVHGSYDQMQAVMEATAQWMEDHSYGLGGPMFNIYHVSPAQDPNPDNWVTEACFPIVELRPSGV